MAWVERLVTRTSQPQDAVGVDRNNPLTRGLAFAWSAANPRYESSRGVFADTNNTTKVASAKGIAAKSTAGQTNLEWNREFISTSNGTGTGDFTMVVFANPSASGANVEHVLAQKNDAGGSPFNQVSLMAHANSSGGLSSGSFSFFLYPGAGSGSGASAPACDGNYYVWTGRRSGNGLSLFKGGAIVATATEAAITNITQTPARRTAIGSRGNGTSESYTQSAAFSASFNRALSDAEIKSLSDNPWQIFEPEVQRIWVDDGVSAGGPGDAFGSASDLTLAATAAIGAGAASASAGAVGLVLSQASAGATGNAQASSPLADLALSAAMATATGDAQSTGLLPNLGLSPAAATATGGATASATASVADLLTSPASASATGQAQTSGSVAGLAASAISGTAFNTALGTALGSPANVALSGVAGLAQGAASTATSVAGIALAAATGAASNTADAQAEAAFAALLINPTTGAAYGASHAVGSLPLVALAAASGTASSATVTKARPASDTSNTGWAASTGVDLYAMLDEEVPSATDYISASSVGAVCEMALNSTTYPGSAAQRLKYRASSSTGHSVIVRLKQGAIVIRSETQALTDTDTEYSIALTPGEIAAITSGALSVQLESAA